MNVELTSMDELKAAQAAVAATTLITCGLTQRFINAADDGTGTHSLILARAASVQAQMEQYMVAATTNRVAQLHAELAAVCEEGRLAEAAVARANLNLHTARSDNANLENARNLAIRNLEVAERTPLPRFYTPEAEAAKLAAIAEARAALDAVLADTATQSYAVPGAMQAKQEAERKASALAAREAGYRHELAALTGKTAQPTGNPQNATGLAG